MEPLAMFASRLLPWLVDVQVRSLVVLALAGGVVFCLRRSSAALRHLVLALAIVSLFVLPLLSLVLPSWSTPAMPMATRDTVPPPPPAETINAAGDTAALGMPANVTPAIPVALTPSVPATVAATPVTVATPDVAPAALLTKPASVRLPPIGLLVQALTLLWAAGTTVLLLRLAAGLLRVRHLGKNAQRATVVAPAIAEQGTRLVASLGLRYPVQLLIGSPSAPGLSPMTWGMVRLVVLLPAGAANWQANRLQPVLLHELAHVQRGDWATEVLARVVCALYWPNPLVWFLVRRLQSESERACDDTVLRAGIAPADYARHLVEVVRNVKAQRTAAAPTALAIGRKSDVEGRVCAILAGNRTRKPASGKTGALALVVAIVLLLPLASLRGARAGGQETTKRVGIPQEVSSEVADRIADQIALEGAYADPYRKLVWAGDSMRVEVLPVLGKTAEGMQASWRLDGSHRMPLPATVTSLTDNQRLFAARVSFPSKQVARQALVELDFKDMSSAGAQLNQYTHGATAYTKVFSICQQFPAQRKKVTLLLRLATGDQTTILEGRPTRPATRRLSTGEIVTMAPAYRPPLGTQRAGGGAVDATIVKVTLPIRLGGKRSDFQLVPIGWDGRRLDAPHVSIDIPDESKPVAELRFQFRTSEVPLSKVKEFRFIARPVRVIEIPNIALQPNRTLADNAVEKGEQAADNTPIRFPLGRGEVTFYNGALPTARFFAEMANKALTPEQRRDLSHRRIFIPYAPGNYRFASGVVARGLYVSSVQPDGSLTEWDRDGRLLARGKNTPRSWQKAGELDIRMGRLELPGRTDWIDKATFERLEATRALEWSFGVVGEPEPDLGAGGSTNYGNGYFDFVPIYTAKARSAATVDLYLTLGYGPWQMLGASSQQQGAKVTAPSGGTVTMTPIMAARRGTEVVADVPARFTQKDANGRPLWNLRLELVDATGNTIPIPRIAQYDEAPAGLQTSRRRFRFLPLGVKPASVRLLVRPLETIYFRNVPTRPLQTEDEAH